MLNFTELMAADDYFKSNQNQITFIVTSPQHKCLGEWNSYERAPDSAKKKTTTIYIWTDSAKNNKQFTYGQTVQKNNKQFTYGQTVQKNNKQFTYGQTVQKQQQTIYIWTDSAKKTTNNLHMDRQCKKNNKQFTYGQTVQKNCTGAFTVLQTVQKNKQKQQQFTYGQYIFTDCTEDNVQNTHTYTQYT